MKSKFRNRYEIKKYIKKGRLSGGAYFKDGIRKVHYVFVLTLTAVHTNFELMSELIRNLEDMGLEFEQDLGISIPVIFIKIHIDDMVAKHYLEAYEYRQEFLRDFEYADLNESIFKTPIHYKNVFKGLKIQHLTLMKVKVIDTMLQTVKYADLQGISKLKQIGIVQDYYPLHDGKIQNAYWHNDDLLNDRTLLAKYWANYHIWYKNLPLDLIHKYFGAEVAFHFAWFDFYNKMLLPIAILGTMLTIWSIINALYYEPDIAVEICNSTTIACGMCMKGYGCEMVELYTLCEDYMVLAVLEFPPLCFYALLVSAWTMLFTKTWKRREYNLRVRWNLLLEFEPEYMIRFEFLETADKTYTRSGDVIYTFKMWKKVVRVIISALGYLFLLMFVVFFNYGKQMLYLSIKINLVAQGVSFNCGLFMGEIHQLLQAFFTILYSKFVGTMSVAITDYCCPKTLLGYDRLFLFVTFSLDFFNNYFPLIHSAFLKNLHYNVPNEAGEIYLLRFDSCDPYACLESLFVQLLMLMTVKICIDKALSLAVRIIRKLMKTQLQEQLKRKAMPQYEEEYDLESSGRSTIDGYFSQIAIYYVLMLSFVYAFPLGPMCGIIHNVLHLRMQASQLVYQTRRPAMSRKVTGIGSWNSIIYNLSVVSALCNILVTGFVGEAINGVLYFFEYNVKVSYIGKAFSEFRPYEVFGKNKEFPNLPNVCYYRGTYYPPDHPLQYQKTTEYYVVTAVKLGVVFAFEQGLLAIMLILQLVIPSMPYRVQKLQYIDRTNLDNKYNKEFNKDLELKEEEPEEDTEDIYKFE